MSPPNFSKYRAPIQNRESILVKEYVDDKRILSKEVTMSLLKRQVSGLG